MNIKHLFKKKKIPIWIAILLFLGLSLVVLSATLSILLALLNGELSNFVIDPFGTIAYFGIQIVIVVYSYKGAKYLLKYIKNKKRK